MARKLSPEADFAALSNTEKLKIFIKQQELIGENCDNTIQRRQEGSSNIKDDDDEQATYGQEVLKIMLPRLHSETSMGTLLTKRGWP
jgi:hypothetical protein